MLANSFKESSKLDASLVEGYSLVLCDLDGCLISADAPLVGALDFTNAVKDRLWIVSNNSEDTSQTLSLRLSSIGFDIQADQICLAGEYAVRKVASDFPGAKVQIYAASPIRALAEQLGLRLVDRNPDAVLLARDPQFAFSDLETMLASLHHGARLIISNLDATHPGPGGLPIPETGALAAAVRLCVPEIEFLSYGKPDRHLVEKVLQSAGASPDQAVFIGDNPQTDGMAAARAGLAFIQITHPDFGAFHADASGVKKGAASC